MIIKFYKSFLLLLFFNTLRLITSIGAAIDESSNKDNKVYCQSLYERPGKDYRRGTSLPGIITEADDGNDRQIIWPR
jgi:hypothetical protein